MNHIALLGGSFNPIHIGHIIAGQCVYDTGFFDEICVIPSGNPPHKKTSATQDHHRLTMCRLAIEGLKGFTFSDIEFNRQGKIYTIDTFNLLKAENQTKTYWLIIGTDSLMQLQEWHTPDILLNTVNFVVVDRGGYDLTSVKKKIDHYDSNYKCQFMHVTMPLLELSSSNIRDRVALGKSIRYRVPDVIDSYILTHGLYRQ